jgi:class 3 adenylate cyclase
MISSKQLMDVAGISRATLNNYIAAGLLPAPRIRPAEPGHGQARRLGYFPDWVVDAIRSVEALKRKGHSMAEIIEMAKTQRPPADAPASTCGGALGLTIDGLECAAYMVNFRFEIEWHNTQAQELIGLFPAGLPAEAAERGLFPGLLQSRRLDDAARRSMLEVHMAIARNKLSKSQVLSDSGLTNDQRHELDRLYDAVEPVVTRSIHSVELQLAEGSDGWYRVCASFFREGILFVYAPIDGVETVLSWLSRRDAVIRDILRKRPPCLTPVAVLIADLQSSMKICAELPPEEYFELINDIWSIQEPLLRTYHATHGKHVGDGMVHYFFPQPDSNYVLNALLCAQEMRQRMQDISRQWQARKNWLNDLLLNIGLDAGEEWFGTYQTASYFEFTVLGDTVNRAARLSDFAREGSIWMTKTLVGKLSGAERSSVRYGIRRAGTHGGQVLIPATYARIAQLCDIDAASKFNDIATVPVTELLDVADAP